MRLVPSPALVVALQVALGAAVLGVAAPPSFAQPAADRATARALGGDGQQALDRKDYKTAEDRFRRADRLVHGPTLTLGLARALAGLGRDVEAQETYDRIVREGVAPGAPQVFRKVLAEAKREVDAVATKVGNVTITVRAATGADVPAPKVVLDGAHVSPASLGVRRAIDPGPHALQASADGFQPAEVRFDVTPGGSVDEPITLEVANTAPVPEAVSALAPTSTGPEAASGVSTRSGARAALPWVAFGMGAAGLGLGAVTGFLAMDKHSTLAGECNAGVCSSDHSGDLDTFHTFATLSTVGFVVGGVGVAAGVVLLLTEPKGETASAPSATSTARAGVRVVPVVGLGSIGAAGTF
jgi:hypothetical protein